MDSSPWGNFTPQVKQWCGETLGDLQPVYNYEWNHTATCCHICRTCPQKQSAEHAPKSSWEKRSVLQNTEKKLVLGFLHSVNHTGSPQNESYIQLLYWAIQQSWFARVNALCNLSRKKSREVANANTIAVAKITVERGWRVEKKCLCVIFWLTRRSQVWGKNVFWGIL